MRLRIRPVEEVDLDQMVDALQESVDEVGAWMSWAHKNYGEAEGQVFIDYARDGWQRDSHYEFAIVGDGLFLGVVGINQIKWADRVANMGYWVRSSATGKGVAPRAVELAMAHAWDHTILNRLEIVAAVENTRSRRVAEKVDAVFEGVQQHRLCVRGIPHDAAMYALLRVRHHIC